jgi:hypothetical protein
MAYHSLDGYNSQVEKIRDVEYPMLKGDCYLQLVKLLLTGSPTRHYLS